MDNCDVQAFWAAVALVVTPFYFTLYLIPTIAMANDRNGKLAKSETRATEISSIKQDNDTFPNKARKCDSADSSYKQHECKQKETAYSPILAIVGLPIWIIWGVSVSIFGE